MDILKSTVCLHLLMGVQEKEKLCVNSADAGYGFFFPAEIDNNLPLMADSDKKADIFPKFMTCSLITRKAGLSSFPMGAGY